MLTDKVLAVRSFRGARQLARRLEASTTIVALVLTALALFAVAQASHLDQPLSRWAAFHAQLPNEGRVGAVETAWPATHDSGWFGFGPGTFRSIFPHYVDAPGSRTSGVWRFLHEDYLQTILEWGWLGSILWAALFMGAMVVAYRNARRSRGERLSRQRMLLPLVCLGLGSAMLHALVDFPLQIASIELYVATYLGICWGSCCWTTGDEVRADTNAAM